MKILAVGAHADDIEIAAGGILSDASDAGHEVYMCITTVSGYDDLQGNLARGNDIARAEAEDAAKILGAKELITLTFQTREMPYNGASVTEIERQINKIKPDIILGHWPHDTHQDHRAAALSTITAARRHNKVLMFEPFTPSGRSYEAFRGQAYFSVTDKARANKSEALRAHKSEHEKFGEETWVKAVEARGVLRGFEVGTGFAECFEVLRWDLTFSVDATRSMRL